MKRNPVNLPLYSVSPVQVRVHDHSVFPMPSPKHCCSHLLFKLDITANQNWDSSGEKKPTSIYFHSWDMLPFNPMAEAAPGQLKSATSMSQ